MTVISNYGMVLCGHQDDFAHRYRGHRIEKVKFGVPINEAFLHDIPATLLVLLLKVNKEGPTKKDIWRAPGNQAHVRKLSHIMQNGRLVNISNFSVYTAASVIKKFLSKLPGGIFGVENERLLFNAVLHNDDAEKMRQIFYRLVCALPVPSQHLLVLLFGTFRGITDLSDEMGTKMSGEAIGISVAPSLFHSCIHDGNKVKVEDVQRFKLASQVVSSIIASFGHTNLFPRECYEFYARITGRTLRINDNWLFTFQMPSKFSSSHPELDIGRRRSYRLATNRLSCSLGEVVALQCDVRECPPSIPIGVDKRQEERMKWRSEWFLSPLASPIPPPHDSSCDLLDEEGEKEYRPISSRSQYTRPLRRSSRDSSGC
uniref:Rho-GAP domain-containing protein n=1 Tax=Pristionchus pacificus TaxID=54126 RepID=A0A8R1UG62_PRIPA